MRYLVVIHKTSTGYSAGAPDVLGCVAADDTREGTEALFREALELHLDGDPLPEPSARAIAVAGYNVVIQRTENGYRAEPQDIEHIVCAADTSERAESLIRETLASYVQYLRLCGKQPPERISEVFFVDLNLPVPA